MQPSVCGLASSPGSLLAFNCGVGEKESLGTKASILASYIGWAALGEEPATWLADQSAAEDCFEHACSAQRLGLKVIKPRERGKQAPFF